MSATLPEMQMLSLAKVEFDDDCQARVRMDEDVVADYCNVLHDGGQLDPITVFHDGATYRVTDGFHRCIAHYKVGLDEIPAIIRKGDRMDAIRHALQANAAHGKRREPGDLRKAYDIAVRCGLCDPTNTSTIKAALSCSERWARDLSAETRRKANAERDARILAAAGAGESRRAIAAREGMSHRGVGLVVGYKRQSAESIQAPSQSGDGHFRHSAENGQAAEDRTERQSAEMSGPPGGGDAERQAAESAQTPSQPGAVNFRQSAESCQTTADVRKRQSAEIEQGRVAQVEADYSKRQSAVSNNPVPAALPPPSAPKPRPIPPAVAELAEPIGLAWSVMMTAIADATAAMDAAAQHYCPQVMAPKAMALMAELERAFGEVLERVPSVDAH